MSVHILPLKESEIFTALLQNDYLGEKKKGSKTSEGGMASGDICNDYPPGTFSQHLSY